MPLIAPSGFQLLQEVTLSSSVQYVTQADVDKYMQLVFKYVDFNFVNNIGMFYQTSHNGSSWATGAAIGGAINPAGTRDYLMTVMANSNQAICQQLDNSTMTTFYPVNASGAITHIRFYPQTGNYNSGSVKVYGIK